MLNFVVGRLFESAVVVLIISFVIYCLIGLMPGDPIDLMIASNPELTSKDSIRLKKLYGLDQPLVSRYWNWAQSAIYGDFGYSRVYAQPVMDILWPRMGNTVLLMGLSLFFECLLTMKIF